MNFAHRISRNGVLFVVGLTLAAWTAVLPAAPAFATLGNSLPASHGTDLGPFTSPQMSVLVVLAPRDQAGLNNELTAVYDPTSAQYQHWLAKGEFTARYAPTSAVRDSVDSYLRSAGLTPTDAPSPFLVRATGSSAAVSAAFGTTLRSYQSAAGTRYFANATQVRVPSGLAADVLGVVGLTDTVRPHTNLVRPAGTASCEDAYPSEQAVVAAGGVFRVGYGGGPGCNGLTPSQTNSIYGAPHVGALGQGVGVNIGLFEQSAYRQSDITTWAHQFYGPDFTPSLVDVQVDGGSLTPNCPAADPCPAAEQGYAGDIEVTSDIDQSLSIAPAAAHIVVYDAPLDTTGQTSLDEFVRMAADDSVATVSSSWGYCERDISAAYTQAENVVFEQMALQGQSVFSASGDSGAFCIEADGTAYPNVGDPTAQPWVTGVGGTSLESDNPGTNPRPGYPYGVETAWNVHNLCGTGANVDGRPGLYWCARSGAGGGGNSQYWGQPGYQRGPGVDSQYTTRGNGSTTCSLAAVGTFCREVPDISANADGFNGYAVFCTGDATTPNSLCANANTTPAGWQAVGGTSLSAPLVAAIVADRDGFHGHWSGNINPLLYRLYRTDPGRYFHDVTGVGPNQAVATNNGLFPALPGYDLATGVGTPRMAALITQGW